MLGNVGWKLKVGAYRLKIGCSTCKSSPQAAFDEWEHAPPLNPLECGLGNRGGYGTIPDSRCVGPILPLRGTPQSGPQGTKERPTWKHRRRSVPRSPLSTQS